LERFVYLFVVLFYYNSESKGRQTTGEARCSGETEGRGLGS
jgi:hypothetical protein